MGHKDFGNLGVKIKNQVSYSLSPFEQKAFAGFFSQGIRNLYRRFRLQIPFIAPGFVTLALVITWAQHKHHELSRKNPADYANDE